MRYLSNDGKDFKTERECLEYEEKILSVKEEKEAAEKAKALEAKRTFSEIQTVVNKLNDLVRHYEELAGKPLCYRVLNNGLEVSVLEETNISDTLLRRILLNI